MLDDVLVNETFARSLSRNGDVIGRHISGSFLSGTIAGVVADFKYSQLDAEPLPEVYTSYKLAPATTPLTIDLFVRMAEGAKPDAHELEKIVAGVDETQPVYDVETLEQSLSNSIAPRRFNLLLMGIIAAIALLMASVGIHGVVAYSVAQRTREIGVRMALGATRPNVLFMIVNQILGVATLGVLTGICAALALTRFMQSLLYDVGPRDPVTLASVALVLTSVRCLPVSVQPFAPLALTPSLLYGMNSSIGLAGHTVWLLRHSQRKRGAIVRLDLRNTAPALDPTRRVLDSGCAWFVG